MSLEKSIHNLEQRQGALVIQSKCLPPKKGPFQKNIIVFFNSFNIKN
jgi:hypothetical protein